jgi:hypothetical protein
MTDHSCSFVASARPSRSSTYSEPPAQSGSLGNGSLGVPAVAAQDHDVVTRRSWMR